MVLKTLSELMLPLIEAELQKDILFGKLSEYDELYQMLTYHMGWTGEGAGPEARGKRIRPLLVTLSAAACGSDWTLALPAASAVELVHNFSLIHDDIEDASILRRGRPTVWKLWGIPQAINAGDALFTLAHLSVLTLSKNVDIATTLRASRLLQETCLSLTQGQYLDMAYEHQQCLSLEAYWLMITGKTAGLIASCTALGAIIAHENDEKINYYRDFGNNLGLAFQVQDDLLGIWGDAALMGKSAESDLITGKKSLPILFGLENNLGFAHRWTRGAVEPSEVPELAGMLEAEGAKAYTQEAADRLTQQALSSLEAAHPEGDAGRALFELANMLLNRAR
jgi:geranylgeranyl diphosphate synthase type I